MRYSDMEFENYDNVLRCIIRDLRNPSRSDIAKHLGLSKSAVSNIVSRLIEYGLVLDGECIQSGLKGRPGTSLSVNPSACLVLGAAIVSSAWQFIVCDLSGTVKDTYVQKIPELSPECAMSSLVEGVGHVLESHPDHLLPGIGIAVPGIIDTASGDIVVAYDFGWNDRIRIGDHVEKATGMKAYVCNRHAAEGIAEYRYANEDGEQSMVYIGISSGIRATIFSSGLLVSGSHGRAGRISHLQIDSNGPLCTCGQHGCLYTLANDEALVGYYHDGGGSSFQGTIAEMAAAIIKAADEGDAASRRAVERLGDVMTTAVRMISVMLDTRKVILGGPIGDSEALVRRMNDNLSSIHGVDLFPSVSRCRIKRYGSALGAVSLVVDDAFALVRDDFFSRF